MRLTALLTALFIVLFACKDNNPDDQDLVPNVPVNVTINTTLPQYIGLQNIGNYAYVNGGYKGLYVFHNYNDEYIAFDRCCTYRPSDSCAYLTVDDNDLTLKCSCCQSQFMMDGTLKQGPAQRSMKQYNAYKNGDLVQITN